MFRAQSAYHQEVNDANCTYVASGIVTVWKWPVTCREWRYQRLHMYNLRRWPPDDERIALETCRGIEFNVIGVNEQEICVSSW